MKDYIAIIHKDDDSDYGVSFPDFLGCVTAGSCLDEAKDMAQEALQFHIDEMRKDGEAIPEPSSLDKIMKDKDYQDGVAFIVYVNSQKLVKKRVNIVLEKSLLKEIDQKAQSLHIDRSAYIAELARDALH